MCKGHHLTMYVVMCSNAALLIKVITLLAPIALYGIKTTCMCMYGNMSE